MRRLQTVVFLAGVLLLALRPVAAETAAEKAVLAAENRWNDLYKAGDYAGLNAMLADDFVITVEDGMRYGKEGYIALVANPNNKVSISDFADLKVRVSGDVAVVTGSYHEKGTSNGKPYDYKDHFTDVWQQRGGKWLLIASQYAPTSH